MRLRMHFRARRYRHLHFQCSIRAARGKILMRNVGFVIHTARFKRQPLRQRTGKRRRIVGRTHQHAQRKPRQITRIVQRQTVTPGLRNTGTHHRQCFSVTNQHAARALRGQRIHAQFVVVAGSHLQQRGVDALTNHVFKHLLAAGFFDGHGFAQLAVDVEREAADLLAVEQGKLQLAFEDAPVGVEEGHLHRGDRAAAADFGFDADGLQHHPCVCALRDGEAWRGHNRAHILCRRRTVNQIESAAGNGHGAHV